MAGAQLPLERLPACTGVAADTAGWRSVADADFEFRLPPAFGEVVVQGFDSHVRAFATADSARRISLDYGMYSSSLDEARSVPDFAECRVTIGGRAARLVTARSETGQRFVAATWRDLRPGTHLTISGVANDEAGRREIASVLRTVQFKFR